MADPTVKTFTQMVQGQAAAIQARASGLIDFAIGSVLRAIIESIAGVGLWLQALVLQLMTTIRASTATGSDLDSWFADFGGPFTEGGAATFGRLDAVSSIGSVTFTRLTPAGTSLIPVGSTVETANGTQKFTIVADTSNPAYDALQGGY